MALKAILDSLDDLSADVAAEYNEIALDGKQVFVLQIEGGVDTHPGVKTMKTAMERIKQDKKKLGDDLKIANDKLKVLPEDFDPEEWLRLKALDDGSGDDEEKKRKRDEHLQGQKKIFEDRIKALTDKHATDMAGKDQVIAEKDTEIKGFLVDGGLTAALVEAGVAKQFMRGAKALLSSNVKTAVEDGKTRAFFETDLGEADIAEYVKQWVQGDEGKAYVPAPTGGGTGGNQQRPSGGADSDNPFKPASWNKTKQSLLWKAEPTKAERLAKAAGFADVDSALKAARPLEAAKTA